MDKTQKRKDLSIKVDVILSSWDTSKVRRELRLEVAKVLPQSFSTDTDVVSKDKRIANENIS